MGSVVSAIALGRYGEVAGSEHGSSRCWSEMVASIVTPLHFVRSNKALERNKIRRASFPNLLASTTVGMVVAAPNDENGVVSPVDFIKVPPVAQAAKASAQHPCHNAVLYASATR
jgi:hypothetical protein